MIEIGQRLPEVLGVDQDGKEWKLSDFNGKKLVLYIYPKDSTPGCTNQACNLRDNYERFISVGYAVLGCSTQDAKSHHKFIEKYDLPFPLLCDTELKLVQELGVYGEKKNGWTHIHGRIPHHLYYGYRGYSDPHHWPEGSEREGSRRANIIERRLTSTLCFPHFAGSTNSNCRFSKGKKELMLAATSKRALAFQVGAVCYMLCFMSRVMRKSLFPERASTM